MAKTSKTTRKRTVKVDAVERRTSMQLSITSLFRLQTPKEKLFLGRLQVSKALEVLRRTLLTLLKQLLQIAPRLHSMQV